MVGFSFERTGCPGNLTLSNYLDAYATKLSMTRRTTQTGGEY